MANDDRPDGPGSSPAPPAPDAPALKPIYNWLSITGALIAVVGFTALVFFLVLALFTGETSGYGGLTVLPLLAITLLGAAMAALGILREQRRRAAGQSPSIGHWSFSLNAYTQDPLAISVLVGAVVVSLAVLGIGAISVGVVGYTDSNAFCMTTCHEPMNPEATVYANSPHARIDCVECHVGHGAASFIEAKISGLRQIYALASGQISRPIPTPIHNQRPSREMCESCHWAERLIDYKVLPHSYFKGNRESEERGVRLMVKVGGGPDESFEGAGIHYHMLNAQKVEYKARDPQRQDIPWVRLTRADGETVEYEHAENPLSESEKEALETRVMECLDCHNRPAHQFPAPITSVNRALKAGLIPRDLPNIKYEAVKILDGDYETREEALGAIQAGLRRRYGRKSMVGNGASPEQVEKTVEVLQEIYRSTIFPEMKADWSAHPDNIGHRDWPGCYRCHNYEMESEDGDTIFKDCTSCHVILAQVEPEGVETAPMEPDFEQGTLFLHPDGDEYMENQTLCSDCHNGGFKLYVKEAD